jgi:hypothetical protein
MSLERFNVHHVVLTVFKWAGKSALPLCQDEGRCRPEDVDASVAVISTTDLWSFDVPSHELTLSQDG